MIGFYQPIISLKTLNMKLNSIALRMCKVQCYDDASKMICAKTAVGTLINEIESHTHLTHFHSHALQLAVDDTIKAIEIMIGALDAVFELNKFVKNSMV